MATNKLWSQKLYLAPYDYLLDTRIVEYDIEKANINILYSKGAISKSTFDGLLRAPKMQREVAVGRMIRREPQLQDVLDEGITEARKGLFLALGIPDECILSIKNDAVFVIFGGIPPVIQNIEINEFVRFRPKGIYSSFYKIFRKEFYYDFDPISNKEGMDIKGIGDYGIEMNRQFINLLCDIFYTALMYGPAKALEKTNSIFMPYVNKQFPIEYYRRLDSNARYDIVDISNYCKFQADMLSINDMYAVDTSYNSSILRLLISYYTSSIMNKGKG